MVSTEVIVAFITGVIGPIAILFVKSKLSKKPKPDVVKETLKVSQLITSKIDEIRDEFHCDRVWITQFHNGGNFYPTGKSMAKFSIIYETVGANTNSIQLNFQNIPVNLFSKSINHLFETDRIEIPDYKDETIATYGLKYIAEDNGCKSSYLFSIKTIEDKFIGVLGLDYAKKKTKLDLESLYRLEIHASAIGGVLNGHLQQK